MQATRAQSGFGLIELMIAMVLGLLVMGAAFAVFQSNQRSYQANQGLSRIQESARVAFELMSRDMRAAGGTACSNLAAPDVEHTATADEIKLRSAPVGDNGTGDGSQLVVTSGDDTAYHVTGATTNSITLATGTGPGEINDAKDAFKTNDTMILCSANLLYVVKAGTVGTSVVTFTPATPVVMTVDPMAPPATVMLAKYRSTRWYRIGTGLFVSRNGKAGEQVADGVTALSFSYLVDGASSYTATPASWTDVVAVRVDMTLQGADQVDNKTISRNVSNVISLRSRAL